MVCKLSLQGGRVMQDKPVAKFARIIFIALFLSGCGSSDGIFQTIPTEYVPEDTLCSTYSNGAYTKTYRQILRETGNKWLYYRSCEFYDLLNPRINWILDEATDCCVRGIDTNPICRDARSFSTNEKFCMGVYLIWGTGETGKIWMNGEHEKINNLHSVERIVNHWHKGLCRNYNKVVTTLLRKAGYTRHEVYDLCDGQHCWNLVKFPGHDKFHIVDTDVSDVRFFGVPSHYPYCERMLNPRVGAKNDFNFFYPDDLLWTQQRVLDGMIYGCEDFAGLGLL